MSTRIRTPPGKTANNNRGFVSARGIVNRTTSGYQSGSLFPGPNQLIKAGPKFFPVEPDSPHSASSRKREFSRHFSVIGWADAPGWSRIGWQGPDVISGSTTGGASVGVVSQSGFGVSFHGTVAGRGCGRWLFLLSNASQNCPRSARGRKTLSVWEGLVRGTWRVWKAMSGRFACSQVF